MAGLRVRLRDVLPHGLLPRTLLIIVVPLILLQVVSGIIFYDRHWANVSRHRANAVVGDIALVTDMLRTPGNEANAQRVLDLAHTALDLEIRFAPGEILPNETWRPRTTLERTLGRSLDEMVRRPFVIDADSVPKRVIISVQYQDGVLHVSANEERIISSTTTIFIVWMIATSVILVAVATLFMANQVTPIRRLAAAADAIGKGRDAPDFKPSGATEVRQAATAFLAMRDRIARQIQQRTEMLAGVSHDLRTPLTRMKLELALLGEEAELGELKRDVAEMERMIEGYLAFARGEGTEAPRPTDVAALVVDVARAARRQGVSVDADASEPLVLPLREGAMRRCIANLVDNATTWGRHVVVSARRNGTAVEISVEDDGPGIPPEQREAAFRPFHRLDPSRNPATGGTGLGLAIAREIVLAHGGEISLGTARLGGLRALVRLPV
ncbi:MAG: ATP-binding protein [Alphaproteobacteria bacterium]